MKTLLLNVLILLLTFSCFGQTNVSLVTYPPLGSAINPAARGSVQACAYDGSSSNYVMLDFAGQSGFLLLTNNAVLWPNNLPSSTYAYLDYNLYVVSTATNVYTISFFGSSVIQATNFYQPQQSQAGWQFGATMYKFHSVGTNVMVEGGSPIYYHR